MDPLYFEFFVVWFNEKVDYIRNQIDCYDFLISFHVCLFFDWIKGTEPVDLSLQLENPIGDLSAYGYCDLS